MFEQRILEEGLYKYYPATRGKVKHTSVGTSVTFNHFLNSERGEVYGLESHPERFELDDWLRCAYQRDIIFFEFPLSH
jgi:all-trans-retinol 13,14-reductase